MSKPLSRALERIDAVLAEAHAAYVEAADEPAAWRRLLEAVQEARRLALADLALASQMFAEAGVGLALLA